MTTAPRNLLDVRALLLEHLGPHGLAPLEVGIVGDPDHRGGYHCGSDRVLSDDYSVVESPRDRAGLTIDASAVDVGLFEVRVRGQVHNLRTFSIWCVQQCQDGAPDTQDIREVIYSPDGTTVRRWDRLRRRSSGDSSHRTHTHLSYFRDATKAGRDLTPLYRRYLTSIGLIGDTMTPAEFLSILRDPSVAAEMSRLPWAFKPSGHEGKTAHAIVLDDQTYALLTANNMATNADAKADQILALLQSPAVTAEAIAAAIPPALARQVVDELSARLAS